MSGKKLGSLATSWVTVVIRFLLSTAATILIITGLIKVLSLFGSAGMLAVRDPV
jgi:hypothetical protein